MRPSPSGNRYVKLTDNMLIFTFGDIDGLNSSKLINSGHWETQRVTECGIPLISPFSDDLYRIMGGLYSQRCFLTLQYSSKDFTDF